MMSCAELMEGGPDYIRRFRLVRPLTDSPASSEGRDSPAHGLAILAVIGGGPVDTPYRLIRGIRARCGALPAIRMEPDRLKSSHVLAVRGLDLMTHGLQGRRDQIVKIRFQIQLVGRLSVGETRSVAGRLRIGAQIDHVNQNLDMPLRLLAASHQSESHDRL